MMDRCFDTEAASALLIGVICQVSLILVAGAVIHWFSNISEVPFEQTVWSGITVLTIGACLLCPFILMFRGDRG
jgi:hypothetical protein